MQRTQIFIEPEQHKKLTEIARHERRSLSDLIREMINEQIQLRSVREMEKAASELLADYQTDFDLTAFTALDSEDFNV